MHAKTKEAASAFAHGNNWTMGGTHQSDTQRFNEFIIEAYRNGDKAPSDDEFLDALKHGDGKAYIENAGDDEILREYRGWFDRGIYLLQALDDSDRLSL